jgi:catechol 2,3-dioxygenase-like lactoylglutathione lyase family enzyme
VSDNTRPCGALDRRLHRRNFLCSLGATVAAARFAPRGVLAQTGDAAGAATTPLELPLKLQRIIDHIGISVPDVHRSAQFFSRLFGGSNVTGEQQPYLRYFIDLPAFANGRNPNHIAVGQLGTLGSTGQTRALIDHICLAAEPYSDAAWRARLKTEGLTYQSSGVFIDPDGIAIQVRGAVGGESLSVGTVVKLPPLYAGTPLVTAEGFDHVILRVPDVEKSSALYQKLFGLAPQQRASRVFFSDGSTALGLQKVKAGEKPGYESCGLRVRRFERQQLARELKQLQASILPAESDDTERVLRFADPDGIKFTLIDV